MISGIKGYGLWFTWSLDIMVMRAKRSEEVGVLSDGMTYDTWMSLPQSICLGAAYMMSISEAFVRLPCMIDII